MSITVGFFGFIILCFAFMLFKKPIKRAVDVVESSVEVAADAVDQFAVEQKIDNDKRLNEILAEYEKAPKPAKSARQLLKEMRS